MWLIIRGILSLKGGTMLLADKIDSIVIVRGDHGPTATMRFKDPKYDRIIHSTSYFMLHRYIFNYIKNGSVRYN